MLKLQNRNLSTFCLDVSRHKNTNSQSWNTMIEVKNMPQDNQQNSKNCKDVKIDEKISSTATSVNQLGSFENRNQSHNTKKVALGQNTKR